MKTCQICTATAADDAASCGACGEGSFEPAATAPVVAVDDAAPEVATAPDAAQARPARGRR